MDKKQDNNKNMKKLALIGAAALTLIITVISLRYQGGSDYGSASGAQAAGVKDGDIVIQVKDVTDQPAFYAAEINGASMEVIAVKASDGTVRTAFNTCQVCYNSGKGYYKYENGKLVCQNCGNSFGMDDVEETKGGCNPVPITKENKTVTAGTITISEDFLTQASQIFEN
jgi:uncharacterized membrane protein